MKNINEVSKLLVRDHRHNYGQILDILYGEKGGIERIVDRTLEFICLNITGKPLSVALCVQAIFTACPNEAPFIQEAVRNFRVVKEDKDFWSGVFLGIWRTAAHTQGLHKTFESFYFVDALGYFVFNPSHQELLTDAIAGELTSAVNLYLKNPDKRINRHSQIKDFVLSFEEESPEIHSGELFQKMGKLLAIRLISSQELPTLIQFVKNIETK